MVKLDEKVSLNPVYCVCILKMANKFQFLRRVCEQLSFLAKSQKQIQSRNAKEKSVKKTTTHFVFVETVALPL